MNGGAVSQIGSRPAPPADGAIARLAVWVLAHRRIVIAVWVLAFLGGAAGAGQVSKRLSFDFSLPGQPGYETGKKITRLYGNGGDNPSSVLLVTVAPGQSILGERAQILAAFAKARGASPRARIVDFGSSGDRRFISSDGRSTYALPVHAAGEIVRRAESAGAGRARPRRGAARPAPASS